MRTFSIIIILAVLFLSFLPLINKVEAAVIVTCPDTPCPANTICIKNPLCAQSFEELINSIIDGLWTISLVLVPMMIIIAGYFFVTSTGDPEKINTAKKMILYALIGFLIITCAKGIIQFLQEVLQVQK